MASFEAYIAEMGVITKTFLALAVGTTASFTFGLVDPAYMIVNIPDTFLKLQIWRPLTAVSFLGKFGFPWLINVAMLVMYVKNHEDMHKGRRAELVWMLFLVIFVLHFVAFFAGFAVLSSAFIMSLVWIFCRRNESQELKIYSFAFRAPIFPWALTAFHLILGQDIVFDLVGIVAGHAYFFFHDMQPLTNGGTNYIACPKFMKNIFPDERFGPSSIHAQAERRPGTEQEEPRRSTWAGQGRRLGTEGGASSGGMSGGDSSSSGSLSNKKDD